MPAEEARTLLQQIQEKIASSDIEVPHRDVLIRLRSHSSRSMSPLNEAAAQLSIIPYFMLSM